MRWTVCLLLLLSCEPALAPKPKKDALTYKVGDCFTRRERSGLMPENQKQLRIEDIGDHLVILLETDTFWTREVQHAYLDDFLVRVDCYNPRRY